MYNHEEYRICRVVMTGEELAGEEVNSREIKL